ncbi:hypothetical protein C7212DRAFT_340948 [Tuber magnatum]|uniref:Uncharacterized protein n=1 Tax=Tuber magnatum TaxID=42249 RepID=A0A317T2A7_9PEZI|nr:hypothetical protein C7212DRAFT_340948 [Tuber magnatum]
MARMSQVPRARSKTFTHSGGPDIAYLPLSTLAPTTEQGEEGKHHDPASGPSGSEPGTKTSGPFRVKNRKIIVMKRGSWDITVSYRVRVARDPAVYCTLEGSKWCASTACPTPSPIKNKLKGRSGNQSLCRKKSEGRYSFPHSFIQTLDRINGSHDRTATAIRRGGGERDKAEAGQGRAVEVTRGLYGTIRAYPPQERDQVRANEPTRKEKTWAVNRTMEYGLVDNYYHNNNSYEL